MFFSVIIPVYNRPLEIRELLESLTNQSYKDFEVIIVEDGSVFPCADIIPLFKEKFKVSYYFIENIGQGFARNFGMEKATGEYFVLFDSDCIIPPDYFSILNAAIKHRNLDAHGGPDDAGSGFSNFQKAINYSMTSVLTTGGIRGKLKDPAMYQARGYNMGLSKEAFEVSKGFLDPNKAEDIELSIRLKKLGFRLELVEEAFVYHKRKNTFRTFLKQSFSFGQNRVNVSRYHPDAIKMVHLLPTFFLLGWLFGIALFLKFSPISFFILQLYLIWIILVFLDSAVKTRSLLVGIMAIFTSFGQLSFYGAGLIFGLMEKLVSEGKS
ncbi:glycosyltransferase [Aquiflexum lacus]|uniref:glycosyltransferase n=1 Tax=Aquiflexum lacus TaxID=2483805 RepID=UPI001894F241|nr:glycosyltransferase [Aquiflexum lacus]